MPFSFPICLENKQGKERHVVILQDLIEIYAEFFPLEFCRTGCSREGQHVADVGNSSEVHHKALKSKAKARMFCTAILAQIQIPPIIFLFQLEVLHPLLEDLQALLTLASADDLSDAGYQQVHSGDRFAIVIQAHIERLDLLRVIGHKYRLSKDLFCEVFFVLGL